MEVEAIDTFQECCKLLMIELPSEGHYMPTLAKKIVDMNAAGNNPNLNFKGV